MITTTITAAAAERRPGDSPDGPAPAEVAARHDHHRPWSGPARDDGRHRVRRAVAAAGTLMVLALGGIVCSGDGSDGGGQRTATTEAPRSGKVPGSTQAHGIEPAGRPAAAAASGAAEDAAAPRNPDPIPVGEPGRSTDPRPSPEPGRSTDPVLAPGDAPITWRGIGEILYGDTLRSVQRTDGLQFTWDQRAFDRFGRVCFTATAPGLDLTFLVRSPDGRPLADPLDGAIDVVGGGHARTTGGLGAGNTIADIESLHGRADEVHDISRNPGQRLMIWRRQGGAYGFVVDGDVAIQVWSGSVSRDDMNPCV